MRFFFYSVFFLGILSFSCGCINAQTPTDTLVINKNAEKVSLGIGAGLDFGGFGGNLLVYPQKNIGFFGGFGYALAGAGYNVGTKVRFLSEKNPRTHFYVMGMYGYNAAIKISGASEYNKIYYGPSFGIGIDTGKRSYKKGYWTMALLIPIRSSEVQDYMDELEDDGVDFKNGLLPFTFSIAYRFGLD